MTDSPRLNILSIDGGGVRGLSALLVLKTLMNQLAVQSDSRTAPLPCDIFDVICGTSTGGLIAIMLGRLRMSVDDAIKHYRRICKEVFGNPRYFGKARGWLGSPMYDVTILERSVKELVAEYDLDQNSDALLEDSRIEDVAEHYCYTFTVAITQAQANAPPFLFRSYPTKIQPADTCTIWEAVRATNATSLFFPPATVGVLPYTFQDGQFIANNPSDLARVEVSEIFPGHQIGCFLSLGTGVPKVVDMKGHVFKIASACQRLAENCDKTAEAVSKRFRMDSEEEDQPNPYFRFSVRGLKAIELDEWDREGELAGITDAYMRFHEQQEKAGRCVEVLKPRMDQIRKRKNSLL
ncbi:FabD/lysophospholipase-like protein [Ramaria rubella]|nr:FabD/lysophospholipase-like protein [Ramaria rubella]